MLRAALTLLAVALVAVVCAVVVMRVEESPPPAEPATGPLVYRYGTYSVRLMDAGCPFADFTEELENEGIPPARAAAIVSGNRSHVGCWVRDLSGDVMMLQADSDLGVLPAEGFKREAGV